MISIAALGCGVSVLTIAQEKKESLYDFIEVDRNRTVYYQQTLEKEGQNRIEYVGKPGSKSIFEIIYLAEDWELHILAYDYNRDFKADLATVYKYERNQDSRSPKAVSFYRGPERVKHSEWHVAHSLDHSFVRMDSATAPELRGKLEALRNIEVNDEEVGFFTDYDIFRHFESQEIRKTFELADSIFAGFRDVEFGDIRTLKLTEGLATRYAAQINALVHQNFFDIGTYLRK